MKGYQSSIPALKSIIRRMLMPSDIYSYHYSRTPRGIDLYSLTIGDSTITFKTPEALLKDLEDYVPCFLTAETVKFIKEKITSATYGSYRFVLDNCDVRGVVSKVYEPNPHTVIDEDTHVLLT